jgi:hypothetical protein
MKAAQDNNNAALKCMPLVSEVATSEGEIQVEVVLLGEVPVAVEVVPITNLLTLSRYMIRRD